MKESFLAGSPMTWILRKKRQQIHNDVIYRSAGEKTPDVGKRDFLCVPSPPNPHARLSRCMRNILETPTFLPGDFFYVSVAITTKQIPAEDKKRKYLEPEKDVTDMILNS